MERPRLRGRLHQVALVASVPALIWLVRSADGGLALVAAWVYGLAAIALYLASSTYHLFARTDRARRVLRGADHAMIFVAIGGSATPICLLALHGSLRWVLLAAIWAGAVFGMVIKIAAMNRLPRFGSSLYVVLGLFGLAAIPTLAEDPVRLALVMGAGALYLIGAVLLALRRPVLNPAWFGYHEVWHSFVVAAGVLLFIVNLGLVSGA